jgi:hypothetical protein
MPFYMDQNAHVYIYTQTCMQNTALCISKMPFLYLSGHISIHTHKHTCMHTYMHIQNTAHYISKMPFSIDLEKLRAQVRASRVPASSSVRRDDEHTHATSRDTNKQPERMPQTNEGISSFRTYDDFVRVEDAESASTSPQGMYASEDFDHLRNGAHHDERTLRPRTGYAHNKINTTGSYPGNELPRPAMEELRNGKIAVQKNRAYPGDELPSPAMEELRNRKIAVQKDRAYPGDELPSPAMEELRNAIRCIATEASSKENNIPPTSLFGAAPRANISTTHSESDGTIHSTNQVSSHKNLQTNAAHSDAEPKRERTLCDKNFSNRHANVSKKISLEDIRR